MILRKATPANGAQITLFVDPDYHRRGIGRKLVEEALRRHPDLATDANEQNAAAVAFYERLGWSLTAVLRLTDRADPILSYTCVTLWNLNNESETHPTLIHAA